MSRIIATASYLPKTCWKNDAFIERYHLDSTPEWIEQRTGIVQRFFAEEETLEQLAIEAARQLLAKSHISANEIRRIIVATMSSKVATPSIASHVQANIQAEHSWAFDVNGACNGFVIGLELANRLAQTDCSGYTLLIGVEKMSQILDLTDRATSVLFGDGAGAVLIQHDGESLPNFVSELHGEFHKYEAIQMNERQQLTMNGRDVFNFVMRRVIPSLEKFILTHQLEDYNYLICHQANQRLLDLFAKQLQVDSKYVATNIATVANTSAASIPILLDELVKTESITLTGEQSIILCGFGAGLSWGHIHLTI